MAKLKTPRLIVILSDPEFPGDDEGREYQVQTHNAELCAYDRDRSRFGWPKGDDAPVVWITFLAWKALMRTGQIPGCSLAEFEAKCLSVSSKEADEVDPIRTAVEGD